MQCPRCQHENPDRAKFCLECGTRLVLTCTQCGTELPPDAKFCLECGHPVNPSPAPSAVAHTGRFNSPQTYTPQHLAERILTSRGALEGERKQVTVLFADLKGSMELLADRDPEEARRLLDPVLERMMEAVHRYEGTVNQVMGDGIMALFGAPLAHEDHAVRACYAALAMQEAVKQYAEEVRRAEGMVVQIRVGLNSGEVVVRSIGSDLRMDYTAVGQTTHLAARMEQLALPGSALLAPETLRLVEGYVQVKVLGPMQVKGLDAAVEAYELLGAGAARSRLQAAAGRGFTKFVGRDAELETLRQTLDRAGSGHGQVVALVGEPGVGKSRLTWEFTHSHRAQSWLALESGSVSYGKATSYLPIIDLLKSYCGIESRDDPRRLREKLTGKLLTLDPALQPMLPAFLALLDLPVEDAQWDALDPPQRRSRTLDACKRLLLRESRVQPLLLVFEDLHWVDTETQAVLDGLVDALPAARLLLLVNYRPEYEHTWHRKTYYRELRLDPLAPESAEELLRALLGDDAVLQPLKSLLIERTEGNPFFLEESVRTLLETGALVGERGAYRLAKPVETTQVPPTVQAVLAARIDRLAPEDKRLLQAAAVVGKDVPYALLAAIAEQPEAELRAGLGQLQAAEFLYEASLYPEPEYTFKHALTHEVAYGSLLQERRRALHSQVVAAIERLFADRLAEQVERLAHHAMRAENWEVAAAYTRKAGVRASSRSAYHEAAVYFQSALAALQHLPPTRAVVEQAIDIRLELRHALAAIGQRPASEILVREAVALAEQLGDDRRRGWTLAALALHCWGDAVAADAIESGQQARAIALAQGDRSLEAAADLNVGRAYHALGDYAQAAEWLRRSVTASADAHAYDGLGVGYGPKVVALAWLADCYAKRGEFPEALAAAGEALAIAETIAQAGGLILACQGVGSVYAQQGELDRAIPTLERAVNTSEVYQLPLLFCVSAAMLGYAYALDRRPLVGAKLVEQAAARALSGGSPVHHAICVFSLAYAHLSSGDHAAAARLAADELVRCRQQQAHGDEAQLVWILGGAAAADPAKAEQAERYYRKASSLAEELGMRPLQAHCHLSLGTLYQRLGRRDEAQTELSAAASMYRAMEMPFWLERTEAVLATAGFGG